MCISETSGERERWLSFDVCFTRALLILEELVTEQTINDLIQKKCMSLLRTVSSQVIMVIESDCETFCEWEGYSYDSEYKTF